VILANSFICVDYLRLIMAHEMGKPMRIPDRKFRSGVRQRFDWYFHAVLPLSVLSLMDPLSIVEHDSRHGHLRIVIVAAGCAALVIGIAVRIYTLRTQAIVQLRDDRLRMIARLPYPLVARIPELTARELRALRKASDAELAAFIEKTLYTRDR